MKSGKKGREAIRSRPEPEIGKPSPGVQHQKDKSTWLARRPRGLAGGAVRNLNSTSDEHVHACLLACSQNKMEKATENVRDSRWLPTSVPECTLAHSGGNFSPSCSTAQLPTRAKADTPK